MKLTLSDKSNLINVIFDVSVGQSGRIGSVKLDVPDSLIGLQVHSAQRDSNSGPVEGIDIIVINILRSGCVRDESGSSVVEANSDRGSVVTSCNLGVELEISVIGWEEPEVVSGEDEVSIIVVEGDGCSSTHGACGVVENSGSVVNGMNFL